MRARAGFWLMLHGIGSVCTGEVICANREAGVKSRLLEETASERNTRAASSTSPVARVPRLPPPPPLLPSLLPLKCNLFIPPVYLVLIPGTRDEAQR